MKKGIIILMSIFSLTALLIWFSCNPFQQETSNAKSNFNVLDSSDLSKATGGMVGFATANGGTSGGTGGVTMNFTSVADMEAYFKLRESTNPDKRIDEPVIIYVNGTISGSTDMIDVKRTQDVSFIGVGSNAKLVGFGLNIVDSHNIIVQNITFDNYSDDGVTVDSSHHVWVDHCTFDHGHDGACDVKKGSEYVTVSWNVFQNTEKTCLFGHSRSETGDTVLKATYHHNWFKGTKSRHPRARYGKAHVFNNYYTDTKLYASAATCSAQVLNENNYYKNALEYTTIVSFAGTDAADILSDDPPGYSKNVGCIFDGCNSSYPAQQNTNGFSFNPSSYYSYSLDGASSVPSIVMAGAGAGNL